MQERSARCLRLAAIAWLLLALATPAGADSPKVNRILVDKSERTLVLFSDGRPIRSYPISLGLNPVGDKRFEGDKRTPEGIYLIDAKNPNSAYHLSLHISYPNERDVRAARARGWDPGGMIMIHGLPTGLIKASSKYDYDWTDGCIAVSNAAIEEIWRLVDEGTLIEITP
ncbi:MAG: L,D-transpeptidase family protein [Pseudomonadales bacterium]|jgi:murein L,D-transpeptidase YafK